MKKPQNNIFIIIIFLALLSCMNSCLFEPEEIENRDLVAITYLDTATTLQNWIVLADYSEPDSIIEFCSVDINPCVSYFSEDKNKLLICINSNVIVWEDYFFLFYIYDIETDSLYKLNDDQNKELQGRDPVWDYDNDGFYFYDIDEGAKYYELSTRELTDIKLEDKYCQVIGAKSSYRLIVYSWQYDETQIETPFFIMSPAGDYISRVNNEYLGYTEINGRSRLLAKEVAWNPKKKEFLFTFDDTTSSNFSIYTTDLNGRSINKYTSGFYDRNPVWGPDNTIFFSRSIRPGITPEMYLLNKNDKSVQLFKDIFPVKNAFRIYDVAY